MAGPLTGRRRKLALALLTVAALHLLAAGWYLHAQQGAAAQSASTDPGWIAAGASRKPAAKALVEAADAATVSKSAERYSAKNAAPTLGALLIEISAPEAPLVAAAVRDDLAAAQEKPPAQPSAAALAAKAAAPASSGTASTVSATDKAYYRQVQARLAAAATRLPEGVAGTARLRFTVHRDGSVSAVQLVAGSGNATLDAAAIRLVRQAVPLPQPTADALTLEVPIRAQRVAP